MSRFSIFRRKIFCLTLPKNLVREPLGVSLNSGMEFFFASEGYVTIFEFLSNSFCLTLPINFVGETFCAVFQKISGSEKVNGSERGEYQDFLSKIICLTLRKNFVGWGNSLAFHSFRASIKFG